MTKPPPGAVTLVGKYLPWINTPQLHEMQSVSVQKEYISGTNVLVNATYGIRNKV